LNKLILIELKKIFHKKSIYVIYILILIFVILNNILILQDKSKNNYLNEAKYQYQENLKLKENYIDKKLSYNEKLKYQTILENIELNKYIIDNNKNVNNYKTLNYQLKTTLEDYEIFIIIIILITSSTIISSELKEGTIKLLLIKPYTRNQILLSKYLSMIIVMFISIIYLYLTQILIGGFYLGFSSLQEKVVIYNFQLNTIMCYNIFGYTFLRILLKLPMLILLSTLSFLISIITSNNILSLTISLIVYIFSASIKSLAINYNLKIMKYLLTMNWNINEYLFGKLSEYKYLNLTTSIIICIIYYIFLLVLSFIIFNKKDIKNI
jgi:ABC-2 type transport system permease protein